MSPDVAPLPLVAMGSRWTLEVHGLPDDEAAALRRRWSRAAALADAPGAVLVDGTTEPIVVSHPDETHDERDEGVYLRSAGGERLAYDLSRAITRRGITRLVGRALMLHAAALTGSDGRAVVLAAPSGTGKSTAAVRLGAHLGYVTDESVVITWDADGAPMLAPYPKPPSTIVDPADPGHKDEVSPDDLGLGATPPAPPLGALLVLERDDAHVEPEVAQVPLLEHLLTLLPETSSIFELPSGLDHLARAATVAGAPVRLRYREIEDCIGLLEGLLEHGTGAPAPAWRHLVPGSDATDDEGGSPPSPGSSPSSEVTAGSVVRQRPWREAIEDETGVLLLVHDRPYLLQALGATLWHASADAVPVSGLVEVAVEAFGDHEDADALVLAAVRSLVEAGVLAVVS